jgi:hypothetical protein
MDCCAEEPVMDFAALAKGFLILHEGTDFCDDCLARALGVDAAQARATLTTLGKSPAFLRDQWTCKSCRRSTLVTRAIANPTFALNRRSRTRLRRTA